MIDTMLAFTDILMTNPHVPGQLNDLMASLPSLLYRSTPPLRLPETKSVLSETPEAEALTLMAPGLHFAAMFPTPTFTIGLLVAQNRGRPLRKSMQNTKHPLASVSETSQLERST